MTEAQEKAKEYKVGIMIHWRGYTTIIPPDDPKYTSQDLDDKLTLAIKTLAGKNRETEQKRVFKRN